MFLSLINFSILLNNAMLQCYFKARFTKKVLSEFAKTFLILLILILKDKFVK